LDVLWCLIDVFPPLARVFLSVSAGSMVLLVPLEIVSAIFQSLAASAALLPYSSKLEAAHDHSLSWPWPFCTSPIRIDPDIYHPAALLPPTPTPHPLPSTLTHPRRKIDRPEHDRRVAFLPVPILIIAIPLCAVRQSQQRIPASEPAHRRTRVEHLRPRIDRAGVARLGVEQGGFGHW
jgi:hypothetical protein